MGKDLKISFHIEDTSFQLEHSNDEANWLAKAVESENKRVGAINYIFCSDNFLHKLNVDYLSHDTFTDIITFDYSEDNELSADIFISIDRVNDNALKFEKSFQNELRRVMVHGILHLCGYKDKSSEEQATMRGKEDFYLTLHPSE